MKALGHPNKSFNFAFCLIVYIAVFDTQVNIRCCIVSVSRPISSREHNATDQGIAMERYQSYFRKLDIFFSGKEQGAVRTDQKIILFLSTIFAR